jgi:hypothetical protein
MRSPTLAIEAASPEPPMHLDGSVLERSERIRTFDILIQSQLPESGLASHCLSVRQASVGRRIGVSQVPIPK